MKSTEHMDVTHTAVWSSHSFITPVSFISILNRSWLLYWEITRNFQIASNAAVSLVVNIYVQTFILAGWTEISNRLRVPQLAYTHQRNKGNVSSPLEWHHLKISRWPTYYSAYHYNIVVFI